MFLVNVSWFVGPLVANLPLMQLLLMWKSKRFLGIPARSRSMGWVTGGFQINLVGEKS